MNHEEHEKHEGVWIFERWSGEVERFVWVERDLKVASIVLNGEVGALPVVGGGGGAGGGEGDEGEEAAGFGFGGAPGVVVLVGLVAVVFRGDAFV
jgi:hypothetical protein